MKVFVYVMTHLVDPDKHGLWGCCNCMGQKRSWNYDAVIGVGGVAVKDHRFRGKVIWIGIRPHKTPVRIGGKRRHKVTFDYFLDFRPEGRKIREIPSGLAQHKKKAPRGFMNLTP